MHMYLFWTQYMCVSIDMYACVLLDISLCIINDSAALICASRVVCSFMVASPPTREHAFFTRLVLIVSLMHSLLYSPPVPFAYLSLFYICMWHSLLAIAIPCRRHNHNIKKVRKSFILNIFRNWNRIRLNFTTMHSWRPLSCFACLYSCFRGSMGKEYNALLGERCFCMLLL